MIKNFSLLFLSSKTLQNELTLVKLQHPKSPSKECPKLDFPIRLLLDLWLRGYAFVTQGLFRTTYKSRI